MCSGRFLRVNWFGQHAVRRGHQKLMMLTINNRKQAFFILILLATVIVSGCNFVKKESKTATLLKTSDAAQTELIEEINRFARVDSMRAKMDLKFEDNSF